MELLINLQYCLLNISFIKYIRTEWPYRQGGRLACWSCKLDSRLSWDCTELCTRRSGGSAHEGGWCDQTIGSTVSDAIVRCWLWSTATRSSPLGYFWVIIVTSLESYILTSLESYIVTSLESYIVASLESYIVTSLESSSWHHLSHTSWHHLSHTS